MDKHYKRHYFVAGRVQGVGFRNFVLVKAKEIGLCGWVRNVSDGRVEVLAEGSQEQLSKLEDCLWQGPKWSSVKEVKGAEMQAGVDVQPDVSEDNFLIERSVE